MSERSKLEEALRNSKHVESVREPRSSRVVFLGSREAVEAVKKTLSGNEIPPISGAKPGGGIVELDAVPDAPLYVLADDATYSDLGNLTLGRTVVNVLPCETPEQAADVLRYAQALPSQRRPRIVSDASSAAVDVALCVFDPHRVESWAASGRSALLSG